VSSRSADLATHLRDAIQAARAAGTSSEWLGEVGLAIRPFRARERGRVPADVQRSLEHCLAEVRKVWPKLG